MGVTGACVHKDTPTMETKGPGVQVSPLPPHHTFRLLHSGHFWLLLMCPHGFKLGISTPSQNLKKHPSFVNYLNFRSKGQLFCASYNHALLRSWSLSIWSNSIFVLLPSELVCDTFDTASGSVPVSFDKFRLIHVQKNPQTLTSWGLSVYPSVAPRSGWDYVGDKKQLSKSVEAKRQQWGDSWRRDAAGGQKSE